MTQEPRLLPAQQEAADWIRRVLPDRNVVFYGARQGCGRSTVLRDVANGHAGGWVDAERLLEGWKDRPPEAVEEAFYDGVRGVLEHHDTVFVDDFDVLLGFVACSHFYPRRGWFETPLHALCEFVRTAGRRLVFALDRRRDLSVMDMGQQILQQPFTPEDYAEFCKPMLPGGNTVDFSRVHRFAPRLNLYNLETACHWLGKAEHASTSDFITWLEKHQLAGNVNIGDVREVDFDELIGAEEVIRSLHAHLIVPMEDLELASELDLKPKRGVLLLGPPGTGKTTIGRALARRMHSKFFLIDGSVIAGAHDFYDKVQRIVDGAKDAAPSVIFIDDTDVIFEDSRESGLYRYLLTLLDGIESDGDGRVCVVMTAMDVAQLPPALIRSGRIELWLELNLPGADARQLILQRDTARLPGELQPEDLSGIVAATEGFTGADLRRLSEDAKHLLAVDRSSGAAARSAAEYFQSAVESVRTNRERYESATSAALAKRAMQRMMPEM